MPAENIKVYAKWDGGITLFLPLLIKYDVNVADGIVGGYRHRQTDL